MAIVKVYWPDRPTEPDIIECESAMHYCVEHLQDQSFHVYDGEPSVDSEVTDCLKLMADDRAELTIIVTHAGDPVTAFFVAVAVITVAAVVLAPKPAVPDARSSRVQRSPNNQLSDRRNTVRIDERIPDIVGAVNSVPDVLMPEYQRFLGGSELRIGLYCVGRGSIQASNIRDDVTPISSIPNYSAEVYHPFSNPAVDEPVYRVGYEIEEPLLIARSPSSSSGVELDTTGTGSESVVVTQYSRAYQSGGVEGHIVDDNADFRASFQVGSIVDLITFKILTSGVERDVSQSGVTVTRVEREAIYFAVNWSFIGSADAFVWNYESTIKLISSPTAAELWQVFTEFPVDRFWVNVVGTSGIYKIESGNSVAHSVDYKIKWQEIDANGNEVGVITEVDDTISGNSRGFIGKTTDVSLPSKMFVRVTVSRITPPSNDPQISDKIETASIYFATADTAPNYGNTTIIKTKRLATNRSSTIGEAIFNCTAHELVDRWLSQGVQEGALTPVDSAIQSMLRISLDPVVGRMQPGDIDIDQMLEVDQEIKDYFPIDLARLCSYTFADTEQSAQEIIVRIADAINCVCYREQGILKLRLEKPQSIPRMLFTHRSKKPRSESITREMKTPEIPDGIELKWTDITGRQQTVVVPSEGAINLKKIEIAGICNPQQAYWRAHREYQKLIKQRVRIGTTLTQEARTLLPNDLVLIADDTQINPQSGDVIAQDGSVLTLSQDVEFIDGESHSIILKRRDGSTEAIAVQKIEGSTNQVLLLAAPSEAIYTGINAAKTEFSFAADSASNAVLWMVKQTTQGGDYIELVGANYSDDYYSEDQTILP